MSNHSARKFQQLWQQMDNQRRRQAGEAFFTSNETTGDRRNVSSLIATNLHLRPQKAAKLPPEKAAAYLATILSLDEPLAALLVRSYLFTHQTPMLSTFLDELKITHTNGVIADDVSAVPGAEELRAAVERVRAAFPPDDVQLYLEALAASDAATWVNLGAALTPPNQ